jgi:hypothetical protein
MFCNDLISIANYAMKLMMFIRYRKFCNEGYNIIKGDVDALSRFMDDISSFLELGDRRPVLDLLEEVGAPAMFRLATQNVQLVSEIFQKI